MEAQKQPTYKHVFHICFFAFNVGACIYPQKPVAFLEAWGLSLIVWDMFARYLGPCLGSCWEVSGDIWIVVFEVCWTCLEDKNDAKPMNNDYRCFFNLGYKACYLSQLCFSIVWALVAWIGCFDLKIGFLIKNCVYFALRMYGKPPKIRFVHGVSNADIGHASLV